MNLMDLLESEACSTVTLARGYYTGNLFKYSTRLIKLDLDFKLT